jgi:hypothetical protein
LVQQWSTSPSFTWTPTAAGSGYQIGAWVRSAGNTVDALEASRSVGFSIGATSPVNTPPVNTAPASVPLTAVPQTGNNWRSATLTWSSAPWSSVDIYRSGLLITNTPNDGSHTDPVWNPGSYTYQICAAGSTTSCSNMATVYF